MGAVLQNLDLLLFKGREMANEDLAIEIAEWFEEAANKSTISEIYRKFFKKEKVTCKQAGIHIDKLINDGVCEFYFKIPVDELIKDTGITKEEVEIIKQIVDTNPDENISIIYENSEPFGECFVLKRRQYVPKNERGKFLIELNKASLPFFNP